jgi:hypothetical protein
VVVCSNFYLGSFTQKLGPKPSLHICLQPEQTSKVGRQRAPLAGSLCRCSLASHRASGPEAFRASGPEAFRASGTESFFRPIGPSTSASQEQLPSNLHAGIHVNFYTNMVSDRVGDKPQTLILPLTRSIPLWARVSGLSAEKNKGKLQPLQRDVLSRQRDGVLKRDPVDLGPWIPLWTRVIIGGSRFPSGKWN